VIYHLYHNTSKTDVYILYFKNIIQPTVLASYNKQTIVYIICLMSLFFIVGYKSFSVRNWYFTEQTIMGVRRR